MALVKGPFNVSWGGNTLLNIEEVSVDYSQDSADYVTVQQQSFTVDGVMKASVTLTLLATDIAALAVVLPQFFVANGGVLSTGETVQQANGAIDLYTDCTDAIIYNDLKVVGCGNPGQTLRLNNARSTVDSIEFDDKLRKVKVKFIGEPVTGEGVIQFYTDGTVHTIS